MIANTGFYLGKIHVIISAFSAKLFLSLTVVSLFSSMSAGAAETGADTRSTCPLETADFSRQTNGSIRNFIWQLLEADSYLATKDLSFVSFKALVQLVALSIEHGDTIGVSSLDAQISGLNKRVRDRLRDRGLISYIPYRFDPMGMSVSVTEELLEHIENCRQFFPDSGNTSADLPEFVTWAEQNRVAVDQVAKEFFKYERSLGWGRRRAERRDLTKILLIILEAIHRAPSEWVPFPKGINQVRVEIGGVSESTLRDSIDRARRNGYLSLVTDIQTPTKRSLRLTAAGESLLNSWAGKGP